MPVMKQKSIQPARNIPYSQGILMFNGTGGVVAANTLVKAHASLPTGQCLNMSTDVRASRMSGCNLSPSSAITISWPSRYRLITSTVFIGNKGTSHGTMKVNSVLMYGAQLTIPDKGPR